MDIKITEEHTVGERVDLGELVRRADDALISSLQGLAAEGDFEWSGLSLSGNMGVKIISNPNETVITVENDETRRMWLAVKKDDVYELLRVVDQDGDKDPIFEPLVNAGAGATIEDKIERDVIQDALDGCKKALHGVESVLKF